MLSSGRSLERNPLVNVDLLLRAQDGHGIAADGHAVPAGTERQDPVSPLTLAVP